MEYRQAVRSQVWHFSPYCSHWQRDSFNVVQLEKLPSSFEVCEECIVIQNGAQRADSQQ